MSIIKPGDEKYHYSDSSHRWTAPTEAQQESWRAAVEAHMEAHRSNAGGKYVRDPRRKSL